MQTSQNESKLTIQSKLSALITPDKSSFHLPQSPLIQNSNQLASLMEKDNQSDSSGEQSEDQLDKQRQLQLTKELKKQQISVSANKKVVIGAGFNMDVTDFFTFHKKKELGSTDKSVLEEYSGSRVAWFVLLYSVISGAMIPGWIMNIPADKILRFSWRFFMQTFMVIPFVLYQYRTCDQANKQKYSFKYIFSTGNIVKPVASSLGTCFWISMITFGFQWTSVAHSIVLGSLSNFFLSVDRSRRQSSHNLELGGQILVCLGVAIVLMETWHFNPALLNERDLAVGNTSYFSRTLHERLTFDLAAFAMSFMLSRVSQFTSDLKSYYPPFLSMLMINTLNCVLMGFSSYFIHGCSFDFHPFFGIWSIFSSKHFSGFMYMAIVLSFGQLVSLFVVTRMFPDPIVPALVMTLEPYVATFIIDLVSVQRLSGTYTVMAYLCLVSGIFLILVGQCLYQRITSKQLQDDKKQETLRQQLQEIKQRRETRKEKKDLRSIRRKKRSYLNGLNESQRFTIK